MIKPAVAARLGRNLLSRVEIGVNRALGRQFVPVLPEIAIEPTSVCNLACTFCAYEKKQSPKVPMKHDRFADYVDQAVAMGYRRFYLTPSTGDVFMDRHLFDKLDLLEKHDGVGEYVFYTNFTIPDADDIRRLVKLRKLQFVTISVYGHDRETFVKVAQSTDKVYDRLVTTLETQPPLLGEFGSRLEIAIRSTRDMPRTPSTDLLKLLERFRKAGIKVKRSTLYHNWGGRVSESDQQGLAIDIMDSTKIYKMGACSLLFTGVQIMSTGDVHACACVDTDGTLKIGNLNEKPLREIVSSKNPLYVQMIEEQERGQFKPVCQACGFYKSIYHNRSMYRKDGTEVGSIDQYMGSLDKRVAAVEDEERTATTPPCAAE